MLDLRFYFALFIRRLPYFLIFTVAGAAIGVTLAMTLPPSYEAEARLVVESEQIPDELAASTVRTEAREQLQIIEQRILTRDTLLEMANRLNIYADRDARSGTRLRPDQVVADLRQRINIRTTGGGRSGATLVSVSFSAATPRLASTVTNEVVTQMLEENVRMRTGVSGQTLEFFEQEVARLDEELSRRGAEIIRFQEENSGSLPESLTFRRNQMTAAQERLLQLNREEASLRDRRASLVALYEATGTVSTLNNIGAAPQPTPAQRRLLELEQRLASSGAILAFENPRIKVLRAQIAALEEQVAAEAAAAEAAATAAASAAAEENESPRLTIYDIQLADLDNQLNFIASRRAEIETEMETLRAAIEATPNNAVYLDTLERDFAATRTQYDQAVINRGRAETGDIIEALSKGERISVVEQAVPPAEPTSPNRPKLIAAGLGGGMILGFGFIALLELLNSSIRRPQDIVKQLEISPLGTLPYIRTRRDRIRRRLLLLLILSVVVAVTMGALWGINEYVMPLDLVLEKIRRRLPSIDLNLPGQ